MLWLTLHIAVLHACHHLSFFCLEGRILGPLRRFEGLVDHHHPLREALVKVFKRRVFLTQPAAGSHSAAGADGSGDSRADDSNGSDCGDGAGPGGNDARLDDEAVAAADPALFAKVCAPHLAGPNRSAA